MAFLRFSRDKRGYEHFYLVQPPSRGKGRPRLLYWFRTPPNIRVGRAPFDPAIQRALESQNPDVLFDWTAIERTPIPPLEAEHWKERRRADRAIRTAAEAEEAAAAADGPNLESVPADVAVGQSEATQAISRGESDTETVPPTGVAVDTSEASGDVQRQPGPGESLRRRRRRRRRRKPQNQAVQDGSDAQEGPQVSTAGKPEEGV